MFIRHSMCLRRGGGRAVIPCLKLAKKDVVERMREKRVLGSLRLCEEAFVQRLEENLGGG